MAKFLEDALDYLALLGGRTVLLGLVSTAALYRAIVYANGLRAVSYLPGIRCLFDPFTLLGFLSPESRLQPALNFQWNRRKTLYKDYGNDTISVAPLLQGTAKIWSANLEVARQVAGGGPTFPWIKPKEYSRALLAWGMNLGGAEGGDVWRRHRRIMGPAFNNKTFALVWDETLRVYKEMLQTEGWLSKPSHVDIPSVQAYTFKLALLVIASCGFGLTFAWDEPPTDDKGTLSLQQSLEITSEKSIMRTEAPRWIWYLPTKEIKDINMAYKTLEGFMHKQVTARKAEIRREVAEGNADAGRGDVFSRLVLANESESEKLPLDDEELIGNVFVLLFAGHETTGHTLAATLGLLGLYQEEQEIVYQQIKEVVGSEREPAFEDYGSLYKVLSAFYEALRLFPAGSVMIRQATRDTVLSVPGPSDVDATTDIHVPKGTYINVDMVGIQYNPRYFPEPEKYMPSRWYEQEKGGLPDTFTAFSIGPRACIGRKFATVEAVCWLTMFLRDFKVEVVLQPGETREQARERLLQAELKMTLAINQVPVRLTRRSKVA